MFNIVFTRQLAGLHIFPAWLMRVRRHNTRASLSRTRSSRSMTWGEVCSFSENELSGAGELCCPSPKMKRSRWDCFQTWSGHVCLRGVNITGVLLIFASRKSLCWGCVVYGNYNTTWCLSPRQFVQWHTEITHMLFAFMRFKGVISYICIIYLCFSLRSTCTISTKTGY